MKTVSDSTPADPALHSLVQPPHPIVPVATATATARAASTAVGERSTTDRSVEVADQIIHLVRTWSYLKARMTSTVDPEISSLFLIGRLVKDGPTRAKDLAEATCADQSTVSRQVAALVKAGLVERQADPDDGRASILVPTALGVARLEKHFAYRGRALEPLVADWSDSERREFVRLLRRFTANLESRREDVSRAMTQSHAEATFPVPAARPESGRRVPPDRENVQPPASTERSN